MPASVVIGQPDFVSHSANQGLSNPTASTLSDTGGNMGGIFVDSMGRLLVSDNANNRVLIWNSIPTTNGAAANLVLGQPDFSSSTLNNGGRSASSMNRPTTIFSDGTRLFIKEFANSRVLIWNSLPTQIRQSADVVVGQSTMSALITTCDSSHFTFPDRGLIVYNGKLIVSDSANARILIWNTIPTTNGVAADVVLGQPDFNTCSATTISASTFKNPSDITVDSQGRFFVIDQGNRRVLMWNSVPTSNGQAADVVLGQTDFTTNTTFSASASTFGSQSVYSTGDRLFVGDANNGNRVLIYNHIPASNGASADLVLGQTDFNSGSTNGGGSVSATGFNVVHQVYVHNNQLFVGDAANFRLLIFTDTTGTGGSVSTPLLSINSFVSSIGGGRLRMTGNAVIGDRGTSAVQYVQASLNGLPFGGVTNLSGGRDLGTTQTIYDWYHDFDPTTGDPALHPSSSNYTLKFVVSDYNADLNYLFYFQPFKFNSFSVASSKSQSFNFSVNKDQLSRIKDNIDHFEVYYSKNNSSGQPTGWTNYISNIPTSQIDTNGLVIATKTTNLIKFIGSYSFKIQAIDKWGNRQDSNTLGIAGISFLLPTPFPTFIKNFVTPVPTPFGFTTPVPEVIPTPQTTPEVVIPTAAENINNIFSGINLSAALATTTEVANVVKPVLPLVLVGLLPLAGVVVILTNLGSIGASGTAFTRILQALGLLPKGVPNGVVYEVSTGKIVPFAVLTLTGVGVTQSVYETLITDSSGIYHGVNLTPGTYKLLVRHHEYSFPTITQRPVYLTLKDYYKGEEFKVGSQEEKTFLLVPLDALTAQKVKSTFLSFTHSLLNAIGSISKVLFIPMLIFSTLVFVSNPTVFNGAIAGIYTLIFFWKVMHKFSFPTIKGTTDPNTILTLANKEGEVMEVTRSNSKGNYKFYSPKDNYTVRNASTGETF